LRRRASSPLASVRLYLRESRVRLTAPALLPATG